MSTQFLSRNPVDIPSQGQFQDIPTFFGFEDATLVGLIAKINAAIQVQKTDPLNFWVVEEIQYQTAVTWANQMSPKVLYSAIVRATKVEII